MPPASRPPWLCRPASARPASAAGSPAWFPAPWPPPAPPWCASKSARLLLGDERHDADAKAVGVGHVGSKELHAGLPLAEATLAQAPLVQRLLDSLANIGADPPGITQAAFGRGESAAHALIASTGEDLGLAVSTDAGAMRTPLSRMRMASTHVSLRQTNGKKPTMP